MPDATILVGDTRQCLAEVPDASVQSCVTSPPYWGLRDYGHDGQIGLEHTPDQYVEQMVSVFREVRRTLKHDGTLWLNLGDSYAGNNSRASNNGRAGFGTKREGVFTKSGEGLKDKDLVGIPWRVAFALQADGWWLRQDIIWHKPNPMPESVTDRCTKAHEYLFLLSKSDRYKFDHHAIQEPAKWSQDARAGKGRLTYDGKRQGEQGTGQEAFVTIKEMRNRRSVWTIPTRPFRGAHFAVMPEALVEPCILAGSQPGDMILDPFTGSGTVACVALRHDRQFIGTELNPEYVDIARQRITDDNPMFNQVNTFQYSLRH